MATKPNIFFIIGAPTSLTFQKFKEFNSKYTNVKLVICADMPTYIKALNSGNVFDGPTNFRAHADDFTRTFHTANGDITTNTKENFKKLQKDIATSLYDIFKTASVEKIETYFAIVPRGQRPLLLVNKKKDPKAKGKIISTPQEDLAVGAHAHNYSHPYLMENVDLKLTEKIRDKLLIPKVYGSAEKLHKIINDKEISKYGATFLSDMITVGCAGLLNNKGKNGVWLSYRPIFGKNKTNTAIYEKNRYSKFGKKVNVVQENLNFCNRTNIVEPEDGLEATFFGYKDDKNSIEALKTKMHEMIDKDGMKLFGNCYVWHDDELNDLDDLPAIGLIDRLADNVEKYKNYSIPDDPFAVKGDRTQGYTSFGGYKKRKKTRKKTKKRRRKNKRKTKRRR